MVALSLPRAAWAFGVGLGIGVAANSVSAQVSTSVTILADKPLQYSNMLLDTTVPAQVAAQIEMSHFTGERTARTRSSDKRRA